MPTSSPSRSPAEGDAVLIAAQSGRALAAAARRAGLIPFVADLFGDTDTLALAAGYRRLDGRFGLALGDGGVLDALEGLAAAAPQRPLGIVLGSGFERTPRLIAEIDRRFGVLGASADAVRRLKDPMGFAALAAEFRIPHPPVGLDSVGDPENWLVKRRGGSGGGHIRPAAPGPAPRGCYLQMRVAGKPRSIAFLGDGSRAQIVAVTAQWTSPSPRAPFRYGGAVEPVTLPPPVAVEAGRAIAAIVGAVGLRGLASADLLVDGENWCLLEINPRPGATLDVIDRRPTPLLLRHIEAAAGRLGTAERRPEGATGAEIVYARRSVPAAPALALPAFVMDRPQPQSRIAAGSPLCTVRADAADIAAVKTLLDAYRTTVLNLFSQGNVRARSA